MSESSESGCAKRIRRSTSRGGVGVDERVRSLFFSFTGSANAGVSCVPGSPVASDAPPAATDGTGGSALASSAVGVGVGDSRQRRY
jgi:hypothetical protein